MSTIDELPTKQIIGNVLAISSDGISSGSCFAHPINSVLHFITAAHVLKNMQHGVKGKIKVFKENTWLDFEGTPYFVDGRPYQDGDIDLAIIQTAFPYSETGQELPLSSGGLILGQDLFFFGFPYFGSIDHKGDPLNADFPLPFVKKAVFSAAKYPQIFFDGHNNPGFSGGPIIFWDHAEKKHKVLGIISAYITQKGEIKRIETSTRDFYLENSGIGIAYGIKCITDLIETL